MDTSQCKCDDTRDGSCSIAGQTTNCVPDKFRKLCAYMQAHPTEGILMAFGAGLLASLLFRKK